MKLLFINIDRQIDLVSGASALVEDDHVTWGTRALCISCNCGWSRGEPERFVLVAAPIDHVVK